jgi:hypothetical protein
LIANHGRKPIVLRERVSRGAGTGLLTESEVDAADDLALLVEILERDLHPAVEQHVAVNLDGLLFVQILRLTDRRDGCAQVAFDFVVNLIPLADLMNPEAGLFEPIVDDGVRALAWIGEGPGLDPSCTVARAVAVQIVLGAGLLFLDCHCKWSDPS